MKKRKTIISVNGSSSGTSYLKFKHPFIILNVVNEQTYIKASYLKLDNKNVALYGLENTQSLDSNLYNKEYIFSHVGIGGSGNTFACLIEYYIED